MTLNFLVMLLSLEEKARRAKAEAEERANRSRKEEVEGRRLVAVRVAEKAEFWYTANFAGLRDADKPPLFSL